VKIALTITGLTVAGIAQLVTDLADNFYQKS
jgi:hypothetical protein